MDSLVIDFPGFSVQHSAFIFALPLSPRGVRSVCNGQRSACRRRSILQRLQGQHSEQRDGFQPPPPLEDDGHVVDLASLQDLFDSGTLQLAKRPLDYAERRTDGYTEPLELYVLGTSHVSETSAADVRQVLDIVRPQSVVVELCKSRAGLMMPAPDDRNPSSPLQLSGDAFALALARSVRIGGQSTALLRAALAWTLQGSMAEGKDGGSRSAVSMYGDFRAAREAAEEMGTQIVLGDRPLEITLRRAWEAVSLSERLDFANILAGLAWERTWGGSDDGRSGSADGSADATSVGGGGGEGGDRGAADELRRKVTAGVVGDDTLETLIAMLAERFPSVVGPLIDERDLYLAWTLKRSRAVCGQRRVVGVVGRAHVPGVMRAVAKDKGGETLVFKKLARSGAGGSELGRARGSGGRGVAAFAARLAVETAAGYVLWELYKRVTAT